MTISGFSTPKGCFDYLRSYYTQRYNEMETQLNHWRNLLCFDPNETIELTQTESDTLLESWNALSGIHAQLTVDSQDDSVAKGIVVDFISATQTVNGNSVSQYDITFNTFRLFRLSRYTDSTPDTVLVTDITQDLGLTLTECFSSLNDSNAINDIIAQFSSVLMENLNAGAAVLASNNIKMQYTNMSGRVREFLTTMTNVVATSGPMGFVYALKAALENFRSSLNSSGTDIGFSDNSHFLPKVYIAGIVTAIISTVADIVSVVLTLVGKVVGFIAAMLVQGIVKLVSNIFDKNSEQYNIQLDFTKEFTVFPVAVFQRTLSSPEVSVIGDIFNESPVRAFEVPGGVIFFFQNASGEYGCEFHPSIFVSTPPSLTDPNGIWHYSSGYNTIGDTTSSDVYNAYEQAVSFSLYDGLSASDQTAIAAKSLYYGIAWFVSYMCSCIGDIDRDYWVSEAPSTTTETITPREEYCKIVIQFLYNAYKVSIGSISMSMDAILTALSQAAFAPDYPAYNENTPVMSNEPYNLMFCACCFSRTAALLQEEGDPTTFWFYDFFSDLSNRIETHSYSVSEVTYAISTPNYSWGKTLSTLLTIGLASVAIAAISAPIALKIRNAVRVKTAMARANVERAWTALSENPSAANAQAYTKAAKKFNWTWGLLSGSKYNVVDYWNTGGAGTAMSSGMIQSMYESDSNAAIAAEKATSAANSAGSALTGTNTIIGLIKGP